MRFRFRRVWFGRFQRDFPGHTMHFGFPPAFPRRFRGCRRFANVAPGIGEMAELSIGFRQM